MAEENSDEELENEISNRFSTFYGLIKAYFIGSLFLVSLLDLINGYSLSILAVSTIVRGFNARRIFHSGLNKREKQALDQLP